MTYDWKEGKCPKQEYHHYVQVSPLVLIELWAHGDGWECKIRYDHRLVTAEKWGLRGDAALINAKYKSEQLFEKVRSAFSGTNP